MSNLSDIYLPVQRIIPFSNVEGIGNRTSIFLQGCNLNCLYCHNPETIAMVSTTARLYSLAQLIEEIKASMPFIRGITVSGGEPTIYARELTLLFREVKKLGLSCYLDSNGFFPYDAIIDLIEETDKFLFDIKGSGQGLKELCFSGKYLKTKAADQSPQLVAQTEGKDLAAEPLPLSRQPFAQSSNPAGQRLEGQTLVGSESAEMLGRNFQNLRKLLALGKIEEVRLVHIKGYYDEQATVRQIASCLQDYPEVLFKLIRVHAKGSRGAKDIAAHLPKREETEQLAAYARQQGLIRQVVIL